MILSALFLKFLCLWMACLAAPINNENGRSFMLQDGFNEADFKNGYQNVWLKLLLAAQKKKQH